MVWTWFSGRISDVVLWAARSPYLESGRVEINGAIVEMLTHSATDCAPVGSGMRVHFVFERAHCFRIDWTSKCWWVGAGLV